MDKKVDYYQEHHLIPRRFKTGSNETVKLTLNEHKSLHDISRYAKDKDTALGVYIIWRLNKKYTA